MIEPLVHIVSAHVQVLGNVFASAPVYAERQWTSTAPVSICDVQAQAMSPQEQRPLQQLQAQPFECGE